MPSWRQREVEWGGLGSCPILLMRPSWLPDVFVRNTPSAGGRRWGRHQDGTQGSWEGLPSPLRESPLSPWALQNLLCLLSVLGLQQQALGPDLFLILTADPPSPISTYLAALIKLFTWSGTCGPCPPTPEIPATHLPQSQPLAISFLQSIGLSAPAKCSSLSTAQRFNPCPAPLLPPSSRQLLPTQSPDLLHYLTGRGQAPEAHHTEWLWAITPCPPHSVAQPASGVSVCRCRLVVPPLCSLAVPEPWEVLGDPSSGIYHSTVPPSTGAGVERYKP